MRSDSREALVEGSAQARLLRPNNISRLRNFKPRENGPPAYDKMLILARVVVRTHHRRAV